MRTVIDSLLKKLELRDPLHPQERTTLEASMSIPRTSAPGEEMVAQGSSPDESILLLSGLTARVNTLLDGSQQITALHIPGDFVDLHSFLLRRMDHSVVALTHCTISAIPHSRLRDITTRHPHLGRLLWLSTLLDAAMHRQWLVGMGRRDVVAQIAHALCEQFCRLEVVGLAADHAFDFPLNQSQLADVLGLSRATVNGAVQDLRGTGVVNWTGHRVSIGDWTALVRIAEFDDTYLQLEAMPV